MSQNDLNNHIWHIHLRTTVYVPINLSIVEVMHGPSLIGMLQSSRGAQQKQQQQHYLNLILILPGVTVVLSPSRRPSCASVRHRVFVQSITHCSVISISISRHALLLLLRPVQIPETVVVVVRQLYHPFTNGQST